MSSFQRNIFQKKLRAAEASLGLNFNEEENDSSSTINELSSSIPKTQLFNSTASSFVPPNKEPQRVLPTWEDFFSQNEKYIDEQSGDEFQTYYIPPSTPSSPIFICHHGAGSSGLTFSVFSKELRRVMTDERAENKGEKAGVFCLDARGHGGSSTGKLDLSIESLIVDFCWIVRKFICLHNITSNPIYLLGHSLGGSVVTKASYLLKELTMLKGIIMIDIVEETAIRSLSGMLQYLAGIPRSFTTIQEAIDWHIKSGLVRNQLSAEMSIPPLIKLNPTTNRYEWVLDLRKTQTFWSEWFMSLSSQFISAPFAKMLVLAGTDNLDKDLMIGQMQGKYQLVVFQESGHFVQEDCASRLAWTAMEFWQRNCSTTGGVGAIKSNWGQATNCKLKTK